MDSKTTGEDLETTLTIDILESLMHLGIALNGKLKDTNTTRSNKITKGEYNGNPDNCETIDDIWKIVNDKYTEIYLTDNPEIRWKLSSQ